MIGAFKRTKYVIVGAQTCLHAARLAGRTIKSVQQCGEETLMHVSVNFTPNYVKKK